MDFDALRRIADETEQIAKTYEMFNEDARLNHSNAARAEFLTTIRYIERYLRPHDSILDIGAGTGAYSLYFAEKGHAVTAVELAEINLAALLEKDAGERSLDVFRWKDGLIYSEDEFLMG